MRNLMYDCLIGIFGNLSDSEKSEQKVPLVRPHSLACPVLPVDPQNFLIGIHLCLLEQSVKYFCACLIVIPLTALAVLYVFLKLTLRSSPLALTANLCYSIYRTILADWRFSGISLWHCCDL